jgi:hypothetical protein
MSQSDRAEPTESSSRRVWPRLLAAIIALGAGAAALIIAIELVHSTLG